MALNIEEKRLGPLLEIVALGPAIFAAANPSFFTARQFAHTPEGRKDIRTGELIGTVLTMTLGVGATLVLSDTERTTLVPLFTAGAVCAVMVGMYEYALHHPRNTQTDIAGGSSNGNSTGSADIVNITSDDSFAEQYAAA